MVGENKDDLTGHKDSPRNNSAPALRAGAPSLGSPSAASAGMHSMEPDTDVVDTAQSGSPNPAADTSVPDDAPDSFSLAAAVNPASDPSLAPKALDWDPDTQAARKAAPKDPPKEPAVRIPAEYQTLVNATDDPKKLPGQQKAWGGLFDYLDKMEMTPVGQGRNFYTKDEFKKAVKDGTYSRTEAALAKLNRERVGKQRFYRAPYQIDRDYIRVNPISDSETKYTELWNPTKGVVSYGFAKLSAKDQAARAKAQIDFYKAQGHTTLNLKPTNSKAYNRAMAKAAQEAGMHVNLAVPEPWGSSLRSPRAALLTHLKAQAAAAPRFDVTEESFKRFVEAAKVTPASSKARIDTLLGAAGDTSGKLDQALREYAVVKFSAVNRDGEALNRYALSTNWLSSVEMMEMDPKDPRISKLESAAKATEEGIKKDTGLDITKLGATPSTAPSTQKPSTIETAQTQPAADPAAAPGSRQRSGGSAPAGAAANLRHHDPMFR